MKALFAKNFMEKPKVSIIIPTYNEEHYLGYLLSSLSTQTFKDFEVLVIDGDSKDKTSEVCQNYEKMLPSFMFFQTSRGVSYQRNYGASEAKADLLLFLDADIILPYDFLKKGLAEFRRKKGSLATCVSFPLNASAVDFLSSSINNFSVRALRRVFPLIFGWTIFATKTLHQKIGGFDNDLYFFEDSDYCQRAVRAKAKFVLIKNTSPYVSSRRIEYEGKINLWKKQLIFAFYYFLYGAKTAQKVITWKTGDFKSLRKRVQKETLSLRFKKLNKRLREKLLEILKAIEI